MIDHSGLLITAWAGQQMVGVARAVSDFSYCCYLSDVAVDRSYQKQGRREDTAGTAEAEAVR
ncbi:GNAT family N-acetyltransferase [Paenibacillus thiaminolyticus]|uniref:GNAT family N-acetyltransferase n=1 Tax=Paenibacillus thiaminolyticus TaxID=49283 RepID=UPI003D2A05CD